MSTPIETNTEQLQDLLEQVNNLPSHVTVDNQAFKAAIARTSLTLPDDLSIIGDYAFYMWEDLALTSLPAGIKSIGHSAFHTTNVAFTSLPTGVSLVGYSFYRCKQLKLTTLPADIYIGAYTFCYCDGLTEITFEGKPRGISSSAFQQCTNLVTINVPWAEGEVENAPWGASNATINYNYAG